MRINVQELLMLQIEGGIIKRLSKELGGLRNKRKSLV